MIKKPNKIKRNFWLMVVFFSFLTVTGLMLVWANPPAQSHHSTMMGSTMGSMMRTETGAITLADLFSTGESVNSSMSSHHQAEGLMAQIHFVTTSIIIILLPFIIGGLVFLVILWI